MLAMSIPAKQRASYVGVQCCSPILVHGCGRVLSQERKETTRLKKYICLYDHMFREKRRVSFPSAGRRLSGIELVMLLEPLVTHTLLGPIMAP